MKRSDFIVFCLALAMRSTKEVIVGKLMSLPAHQPDANKVTNKVKTTDRLIDRKCGDKEN